jgi:hypothetical protein
VAASSEAETRKLLGSSDVHGYHDESLARRRKRRPGIVFRKLFSPELLAFSAVRDDSAAHQSILGR